MLQLTFNGLLRWFKRPAAREATIVEPTTIRAKYDSAQTARDNQNHWAQADGLSAAAANSPDVRRTLRNRSRYEVANNSYASGMVRTLSNDVIGRGPSLQMLSGNKEADSAVETAFYKWATEIRLADKLRVMRMARCVDGETFAVMVSDENHRHPVQLDLRVYEAEQVANPTGAILDENQSDGITFDQFGNPTSYSVLKEHPGDMGSMGLTGEAVTVPAPFMLHLFRAERPGQVRGIPEIMPSLPLYAQLRRYTLAVIAAAETVANIAGLLKTQGTVQDPDDVAPLDLFDLERGQLMTLPKGWDAIQMKAEQPATTYEMFKRQIIQEIGRCLNMPFNVSAGDSSGYNYSSGRMDHQVYFKSVEVDRFHDESDALDRIFPMWWAEAVAITRAGVAQVIPTALMEFDTPPAHEWRWDGREHVDPQKEANASVTLVDAGLLTEAEYHGKRGKDWEEVDLQRSKELGVSVEEYRKLKREKLFAPKTGALPAPSREEDDDA
jgi:lambda family phage portal protein